jgi:hypothetical protein
MPVCDFKLAGSVLEQRYHCGPDEELVVAEVYERKEQRLARKLHTEWEGQMSEFLELMNCS